MLAQNNEKYQPYQSKDIFQTHLITFNGVHYQFVLPQHYTPFKFLGKGAYGIVCAAYDKRIPQTLNNTSNRVAIKKVCLTGAHPIMLKRFLRQIKILRILKHRSIIKLKDIVLPKCRQEFKDLYLVFEELDCDLDKAIGQKCLKKDHLTFFSCKILQALYYIHSLGILHRDLKPQNILITKGSDLRISDFGLSRVVCNIADPQMTEYVVTRWYRAPELLMGGLNYTQAVDIWSAGCVIAELLLGRPIFCQKTNHSQIQKIIEFTGIKQSDREFYGDKLPILGIENKQGNYEQLKATDPQGADLISKMLKLNPNERMSIKQALCHPFLSRWKHKLCAAKQAVNPLQFQFQTIRRRIGFEEYKDMIYQQTLLHHFPAFQQHYISKLGNGESIISHIIGNDVQDDEQSMDEEFVM